jgi:tRNA (mo5U34)-methyltransferase
VITPELRERISKQYYFHRIDLGNGIFTPGHDMSARIKAAQIPEDLRGKTVLDIGCWDGAFSFECEKRGALRVLATDHFVWQMYSRAGFDLAHEALGSAVESKAIRVEDLSPETVGKWDLVLFLGVLYHAKCPLVYLERLYSVTRIFAIVETHIDALDFARPAMVFYPGKALNNDPTNYFGPNPAAVEAMLYEVGFKHVRAFPPYEPTRQVFHAWV